MKYVIEYENKWTFIPVESKPRKILQHGFFRFLGRSFQVCVLYSKNKFPTFGPKNVHFFSKKDGSRKIYKKRKWGRGEQPSKYIIKESSSGTSNMEITGRRRSKSNTNHIVVFLHRRSRSRYYWQTSFIDCRNKAHEFVVSTMHQ